MASALLSRLGQRRALVSLLLLAAAAWIAVVVIARNMGDMPGTMGLGFGRVRRGLDADDGGDDAAVRRAVRVALYAHVHASTAPVRLTVFARGLLAGVGGGGVPAYGLAWVADRLVADHRTAALARRGRDLAWRAASTS